LHGFVAAPAWHGLAAAQGLHGLGGGTTVAAQGLHGLHAALVAQGLHWAICTACGLGTAIGFSATAWPTMPTLIASAALATCTVLAFDIFFMGTSERSLQ
jgi:hypothetical protein